MRVPMIATKAMTYATRRLQADDQFDATRNDARVLSALGRARLVEEGSLQKTEAEVLHDLRAEYQEKVGKRPFNGWDAATLREKIAAAKG